MNKPARLVPSSTTRNTSQINANSLSDLKVVWKSVEELKAGLERTGKRFQTINKDILDDESLNHSDAPESNYVVNKKINSQHPKNPTQNRVLVRKVARIDKHNHYENKKKLEWPLKKVKEYKILPENDWTNESDSKNRSSSKGSDSGGRIDELSKANVRMHDRNTMQEGDVQVRYLNENPFEECSDKSELLHYCPKISKNSGHYPSKSFDERLAAGFNQSSENSSEYPKDHVHPRKKTSLSVIPKHVSRSHSYHTDGKLDGASKKPFKTKSVPHSMSFNTISSTVKNLNSKQDPKKSPEVHEVCSWPNLKKKSGLQKIKELVEKQQQDVATRIHSAPEINGSNTNKEETIHDFDESTGAKNDTAPVRKITVAPRVSEYSGFSIPERIHHTTSKMGIKTKKPGEKENNAGYTDGNISGKRMRKQEKKTKTTKVAKVTANIQDYIICPSSWRKGQQLAEKELGPFKPKLPEVVEETKSTETSGDKDGNENEMEAKVQKKNSTTSKSQVSSELGNTVLNSVEHSTSLKPVKDKLTYSGALENESSAKQPLNSLTKVLANSEENNKNVDQPPSDSTKPKKSPPNKRKAVNPSAQDKEHPLPKVRHYDTQIVRNYIEKRRKERILQLQADKLRKKLETEERLQKLQLLQQRQKKLVQANLTKRPTVTEEVDRDKNSVLIVDGNLTCVSQKQWSRSTVAQYKKHSDSKRHSHRQSGKTKKKTCGALDLLHSVEQKQRLAFANSNSNSGSDIDDEKFNFHKSEESSSQSNIMLDQENEKSYHSIFMSDYSSISSGTLPPSQASSHEERLFKPVTTEDVIPEAMSEAQTYKDKQAALNSLAVNCKNALDEMIKKLDKATFPKLSAKINNSNPDTSGTWNAEKLKSLRSTTEALKKRIIEESIRITHSIYAGTNCTDSNTNDIKMIENPLIDRNVLQEDLKQYVESRMDANSLSLPEQEMAEFETRHERIVQNKQQIPGFEGKLPGVSSLVQHAQRVAEQQMRNLAATKIQSLFRGYRVRKAFKWKLPSGRPFGDILFKRPDEIKSPKEHRSFLSRDSSLDGDVISSKQNQLSDSLYKSLFCPSKTVQQTPNIKYSMKNQYLAGVPIIADEKPDPYNFINTVQRSLQQGNVWIPLTPSKSGSFSKVRTNSEMLVRNTNSEIKPFEELAVRQTTIITNQKGQANDLLENYTKERSAFDLNHTPKSYSSSFVSNQLSENSEAILKDFKTSTPYTPSYETSDKQNSQSQHEISDDVSKLGEETLSEGTLSEETSVELHLTYITDSDKKTKNDALVVKEEENIPGSSKWKPEVLEKKSSKELPTNLHLSEDLQFSPATLKLRMSTELTYLDSVEESLKQLGNMEHIQAVALAQQETVTLAQALKENNERCEIQAFANEEQERMRRLLMEVQQKHEGLSLAMETMQNMRANESLNINTQRLLEAQAEAAKITAEAAKQLAEAQMKTVNYNASFQTINKIATDTATSAAIAAVTSALDHLNKRSMLKFDLPSSHKDEEVSSSSRDTKSRSSSQLSQSSLSRSGSWHSQHTSNSNSKVSMKTYTSNDNDSVPEDIPISYLEDSSPVRSKLSDSTTSTPISEESAMVSPHEIKSSPEEEPTMSEGSIVEDIEEDDHSSKILESLLEASVDDQSLDNTVARNVSDDVDSPEMKSKDTKERLDKFSSEDSSPSNAIASSHLAKENSFTELTMQLVSEYVKEEELRTRQEMTLLKLREKALVDKTRQELASLKAQRKELRDKGEEDKLPNLRKRQRGILLRLQQEQAEIRQFQEAQMIASKERQMLLQQQKHLIQLRQSSRQMLTKIRDVSHDVLSPSNLQFLSSSLSTSSPRETSHQSSLKMLQMSSSANDYYNEKEDHVSATTPTDDYETNPKLSDPEIDSPDALSPRPFLKKSKFSSSSIATQVISGLKKLQASKRNLTTREQKLLQRRQDVEELLAWKQKLDKEEKHIRALEVEAKHLLEQELVLKNSPSKDDLHSQQNGIHPLASDSSANVPEELKSIIVENGSENSVIEEVISHESSKSVPEEKSTDKKTSISSNIEKKTELMTEYQTTFESSSSDAKQKPLDSADISSTVEKQTQLPSVNLRLPLSPRTHVRKRRDSSGSEDSFTISQSETASDLSDIEGRIHALKEELRRRKNEAERLRKEQKRRSKERLKAQEESLVKQIEAYDKFIWQTKSELEKEIEFKDTVHGKLSVKPQIRQPKVSESRHAGKLQTMIPNIISTGHDAFGDEILQPSARGSLQESPVLTPREDLLNTSPSESTRDRSKRTSLENETIEKSVSVEESKIESRSTKGRGDDEIHVESDFEESTSDSVKTVTEMGEGRSEKTEDVSNHSQIVKQEQPPKSESIKENENKSVHSLIESMSLSEVKVQKGLDSIPQNFKNNLDPADTQSEIREENKADVEEQLNDVEIEEDPGGLDDRTSVASLLSIDNEFSDDDKSIAEDIERNTFNEGKPKSSVILLDKNQEAVSILDDELLKSTSSIDNSLHEVEELQNDAEAMILPLETINLKLSQHKELSVIADTMTEKLFEKILQEAITCFTEFQTLKWIPRLHVSEAVVSEKLQTEASGFVKQFAFPNEDNSLHSTEVTSKEDLEAKFYTEELLNNIVKEGLDSMIPLYIKRQKQNCLTTTSDISNEIKPSSCSITERVTNIMNLVERNTMNTKEKLPLSNVLSLSAPESYREELESVLAADGSSYGNKQENLSTDMLNPTEQETYKVNTEVLSSDQEWFDDDLGLGNQVVGYQIYPFQQYYYIREIPNKPPPPYVPPKQGNWTNGSTPSSSILASSDDSSFVPRQETGESIASVLFPENELQSIIRNDIDNVYASLMEGIQIDEIMLKEKSDLLSTDDCIFQKNSEAYRRFVFDLCKETLCESYGSLDKSSSSWIKPNEHLTNKKPFTTKNPQQLLEDCRKQVLRLLAPDLTASPIVASAINIVQLGRKKRELVDEILVRELREEELGWVTYDRDEDSVKNQLTNSLFDLVKSDAINQISLLLKRKMQRQPER